MSPQGDEGWKLLPGWSAKISGRDLIIFSDVRRFKVSAQVEFSKDLPGLLITGLWHNAEGERALKGASGLIEELRAMKLLMPVAGMLIPDSVRHTSSRQAEYFEHIGLDARDASRRIVSSRVLVLGLGGTGSIAIQHLVGAGVRDFVLVDYDTVEAANFERQFLYASADLGRLKVDAARDYVLARKPSANLRTFEAKIEIQDDIEKIIQEVGDVSLVLLCLDDPPEAAFEVCPTVLWDRQIPFLQGGVMIRSGFYGPLFDHKRSSHGPREFLVGRPEASELRPSRTTICFAPYNTIIASAIAADAIHYLAGAYDAVDFNTRTFVDFQRGTKKKIGPRSCV